MKKITWMICLLALFQLNGYSQNQNKFNIPRMPDPLAQKATLEREWKLLQQSPPKGIVREGFLFLLDALDTHFLTDEQTLWVLHLLRSRIVTDTTAQSFGNMYWGWADKNNDVGDGNNVEFCVQYGILIKILFDDRLSSQARKALDEIFQYALIGLHKQNVRISYTNIYVMKAWNLLALGQVYKNAAATEEGREVFNKWLNHVARYGNREYDSPTYCGVDLESLVLLHKYINDDDIKKKAADAINFSLTDLSAHYNVQGGFLGGAHSRDYNRVFGRDLLEEKYLNPLLGWQNKNDQLFNQVCFTALQEIGLTPQQKELMNGKKMYVVQRWDSLPNAYACEYVGNKFSLASSNQTYSPDDKSLVAYLNSKKIPEMLNITYVAEGRDDPYGTWAAEGKGEKMKKLMPANYPSNGGWGKTRHLMPFIQAAQNKNEFVMLVAGMKDQNCINSYINSTIVLPNAFDEIWIGNRKINILEKGRSIAFDTTNTFFARFEDVVIAFRILWDNADKGVKPALYNDGFEYKPAREYFSLKNNKGLRITLKHPDNGVVKIAMWWKIQEGINSATDFLKFRQSVLSAPVSVSNNNGVADISVLTPAGKLGVKADLIRKRRLDYYLPTPLPKDFLFNVDGKELGKPIMKKYILKGIEE
ncbi:hypothetical protein FW778_03980 [Ginsengibacter hankyongi]|uniref:Uncharacterized protein n=1 Tax=Ginsengibacter hankyongi TaxID=2607284 RepID=A0A5J5ILG7_9BACT|nr:hypothetical protein [Ginsengibacter hankyongi]KAA9041203.1 hypothetical protein FW778_03980 [Ginsengibacter hankyongi]